MESKGPHGQAKISFCTCKHAGGCRALTVREHRASPSRLHERTPRSQVDILQGALGHVGCGTVFASEPIGCRVLRLTHNSAGSVQVGAGAACSDQKIGLLLSI